MHPLGVNFKCSFSVTLQKEYNPSIDLTNSASLNNRKQHYNSLHRTVFVFTGLCLQSPLLRVSWWWVQSLDTVAEHRLKLDRPALLLTALLHTLSVPPARGTCCPGAWTEVRSSIALQWICLWKVMSIYSNILGNMHLCFLASSYLLEEMHSKLSFFSLNPEAGLSILNFMVYIIL